MNRFFVFAILAIAAFATAAWGDNDGARSFTIAPEISRSPQEVDGGGIAFQVKNIQVEAEWYVDDDSGVGLTIDKNSGVLTWPSDISAQEVVVIVRVEDNFSKLNSAYVNLTASATITINFVSPKMYIIAGFGGNDVWSSADGKTWAFCNSGVGTRRSAAMAVLKGKIYMLGGRTGEFTSTNTNAVSSMRGCGTGAQWDTVKANNSPHWSKRDGLEVAVLNNTLFLTGGFSSPSWKNDVWSSTDGATWSKENSTGLSNRSFHRMLSHKGTLYISGGYSGTSGRNDFLSSTDGASWTGVSNGKWPSRLGHGFVVHNNLFYVIGGHNQYYRSSDSSVVYEFRNDVWSSPDGKEWSLRASNIGGNRSLIRAVSLNGKIYIMGGIRSNNLSQSNNNVWSSPDGTAWSMETGNAGWAARYNYGAVLFN